VFLVLAFGSLQFLQQQRHGTTGIVRLSIPVIAWLLYRDEQIGIPVCT
jgi:hypothetical protein